jgi:hypothetical protein
MNHATRFHIPANNTYSGTLGQRCILVPVVWRHACNTPPVEGRKPTEGTQGVRGARAACQTTGTSIHRDPSAQTVCWSRWIPVYIGARCLACCRTAAGVGIFVWLGLLLLLVVLNLVVMVQQRHKATCHARNHDIGRRVWLPVYLGYF